MYHKHPRRSCHMRKVSLCQSEQPGVEREIWIISVPEEIRGQRLQFPQGWPARRGRARGASPEFPEVQDSPGRSCEWRAQSGPLQDGNTGQETFLRQPGSQQPHGGPSPASSTSCGTPGLSAPSSAAQEVGQRDSDDGEPPWLPLVLPQTAGDSPALPALPAVRPETSTPHSVLTFPTEISANVPSHESR